MAGEAQSQILTELGKLNAKLEGIDDKYELLRASINDTSTHIQKKIESINQTLMGNGDPSTGLVVRLTLLERAQESTAKKLDAENEARTWQKRATVGAFLSGVSALAVVLVKWLMKI